MISGSISAPMCTVPVGTSYLVYSHAISLSVDNSQRFAVVAKLSPPSLHPILQNKVMWVRSDSVGDPLKQRILNNKIVLYLDKAAKLGKATKDTYNQGGSKLCNQVPSLSLPRWRTLTLEKIKIGLVL